MSCGGAEGLCDRPEYRGTGFCRGHYERKLLKLPTSTPLRQWGDPKRTLFEAALALAFVEGDEAEFLRVIRRFWAAHKRAAATFRNKVGKARQSRRHVRKQARP